MFARSRIALLAFAGVLAGAAPAMAQTGLPDLPPSGDPAPAAHATTQLGLSCARCAAHVAFTAVPLYQDLATIVQKLAPEAVGADVSPAVGTARSLVGGALLGIQSKDQPQSIFPAALEQIGFSKP
jgi:hypothetical protein